jgi:TfoX/Sxy family transcriptional regulator of competence genes
MGAAEKTPANVLADRVRAALAGRAFSEKPMFGGICFLVNGNMTVAASKRGLLVRVGKDDSAAALRKPGTRPMIQRGRPLDGYLYVDDDGTRRDADLRAWVGRALAHVATLPAKMAARPKTRRGKT